jgi:hypothetical protein
MRRSTRAIYPQCPPPPKRKRPDHQVHIARSTWRGPRPILGVGPADLEYLADALRVGVLEPKITDVRDNAPFGVLCEVDPRRGTT